MCKKSYLIFAIFCLGILSSCKTPKKDDSIIAISLIESDPKLSEDLNFDCQKLCGIIFLYHDTIFKMEIANHKYFYYNTPKKVNLEVQKMIKHPTGLTIKKQVEDIKKTPPSCNRGSGYLYIKENNKSKFLLCPYSFFTDMNKLMKKEIPINKAKLPQIFNSLYCEINSKHWDYFMSEDYAYKDFRINHVR